MQQAATGRSDEFKKDVEKMLISLSYNEKLIQMDILEETLRIAHRKGEISESDFGLAMGYLKELTQSIGLSVGKMR